MRWIVAAVLSIIVAWALYVASPYYALYRLGIAVEDGNVAEVATRVNVRALRFSLANQIADEVVAAEHVSGGIAGADAQRAAGAALALADPLLDGFVVPDGLIRLLRTAPSGAEGGTAFGRDPVGFDDLDDFLAASSWRGFRNIYFLLPPSQPKASRFRLQMRLGRLRWRVVSLELPPELKRRIAADLVRRRQR